MQVEDIQPGLLDKTPMSNIYVDNTFSDKYLDVANFSDTSHIKLPTLQSLIGTVDNRTEAKPDFYSNIFQNTIQDLKKKDETFLNPKYEVGTLNPNEVLPYVQQSTNYDNNISAAFGQAGKGIVIGGALGAGTGAVGAGVGAIPGAVVGGAIGGVTGFLSGLLGESGKQDFKIGFNNRERTAQIQSGINRLSGFTNHVIDRSFEAGLGGTAALLSTPFGALAGKDMYEWGDNPLTARLSKGLEESEYTAKLSDSYLSKGPIAKLFTGEGFQNEMADMVGFTVGMMVGTKGLGLLNKGAGLLAAPLAEATGAEQLALRMAKGDGLLGQVLPTIAKQSSSYFTRGAKLASEGVAYDEQLMFQGWGKGIKNVWNAGKAEGVGGALSNVGKGIQQFPTKFTNFFKDGTSTLNALSSFERTALASYGEARVEAASSYKDIYDTAIRNGFSFSEASNMATEGANRTLGMNMILLGMTNQFGLNNIFKPRNVLPDLAKWLTKDYVFDASTRLVLKNVLTSALKNMGKGFVFEGFAEELGQHTIGETNKRMALNTNNPIYKSFLQEFINTYKESITSDEGISNWFGGGLFGAITGMFGLDGGIIGSFQERNKAKNFQVPQSIQTKMTQTSQSIMNIMDHTAAFNGQLYTAYNKDEQGNLVPDNQGKERFIKDPSTIFQLSKALESITTLTKDQVSSIVNATSLEELLKNSSEKDKKILEDGFKGINSYLEHIDSLKESKDGVAEGFVEFVEKLTTQQRNNVMTTLNTLQTAPLSEKSKSVQDILKQQLLSSYVYDHVSNGVEDKLFDELDLIEKTLNNPNANIQDLDFLGKKYKQGEQGQALEDLKKQRKDIQEQVNIYRNLQLRFGQPLSYEYLRDKDGNIQKHAITVPLKKVFRSAVRQKQLQKSIKENKDDLDKLQGSILEQYGEDTIIKELDKGLKGDLSNMKLTEKLLEIEKIDQISRDKLGQYYINNLFLENLLKNENKDFNYLIDAKRIIAQLHKDFKNFQELIDEDAKVEEDKIKEDLQAKAAAEKKAKEQAEFEEKQRQEKEAGLKTEAQLKKEREAREKKEKEEEASKTKNLVIASFNSKIPNDSFKVTDIKNGNILTIITKEGVISDITVDQFNAKLKETEEDEDGDGEEDTFMDTVNERKKDTSPLPELTSENFRSTIGVDFRDKGKTSLTPHEKALNAFFQINETADLSKNLYYLKPYSGTTIAEDNPIRNIWFTKTFTPTSNDVLLVLTDIKTNEPVMLDGSYVYATLPTYSEFVGKTKSEIISALFNPVKSGYHRYRLPLTENLTDPSEIASVVNDIYVPIVEQGLKEREAFIALINNPNVDTDSLKITITDYREGVKDYLDAFTLLEDVEKVDENLIDIQPSVDGIAKVYYNEVPVVANREFLQEEDLDFIVNQLVEYSKLESKSKSDKRVKSIRSEIEKLIYIKTLKDGQDITSLNKKAISLDWNMLYRGGQSEGLDITKATAKEIKDYLTIDGTLRLPYHIKTALFGEKNFKIGDNEYETYKKFLISKVLVVNYDITKPRVLSRQANFAYPSNHKTKPNGKAPGQKPGNTLRDKLEALKESLLNGVETEVIKEELIQLTNLEEFKAFFTENLQSTSISLMEIIEEKKLSQSEANDLAKREIYRLFINEKIKSLPLTETPVITKAEKIAKLKNLKELIENTEDLLSIEESAYNIIDPDSFDAWSKNYTDNNFDELQELAKNTKWTTEDEFTTILRKYLLLKYITFELSKLGVSESNPALINLERIKENSKLDNNAASRKLAEIAKSENIDLSKLTREEYADYAIKNGLKITDTELRNAPELRTPTTIDETMALRKSLRDFITEGTKNIWNKWTNKIELLASKSQKERYILDKVRVLSATSGSRSWLFFSVNDVDLDQTDAPYKSYFSLRDFNKINPEKVVGFMKFLQERGYNGHIKLFQDLVNQGVLLNDQFVMHGLTESDAKLGEQLAKEYFKEEIKSTGFGKDGFENGKSKSYSQILSDKISNDIDSIIQGKSVESLLSKKQPASNQSEIETKPEETIAEKETRKAGLFKKKGKGAKRLLTRNERDSYIRENIEAFKTWMQEVLPQFPIETTKDVIDGIAEGMFYKNVITLWDKAETGTGFHEAFEAVWNTLLTKEQRDDLRNEFKSRQGTFKYPFSNEILAYSQATSHQIKETIAEEFRTFMLNKQLSSKQPIKNNFFLRLWDYIKELINNLTGKQKNEISKIDTLFNEISQGKLKKTEPNVLYAQKEYRLIKEDEMYIISSFILANVKSKVFDIFSDITNKQDILLLDDKNNDLLNEKLEEVRLYFENYDTDGDETLEEIKETYFTEEGFEKYTLPQLRDYLNTLKIETELVEESEEESKDRQNFIESMYIDSKNLVSSAIKTLVHTLSNKEYNEKTKQVENIYGDTDYFGDYNTFVDGHKVINMLQNILSNTPSRVVIGGKVYNAIDLMFEKLDQYENKKGYEWIPELKERVNKSHSLRMAFEKSFTTTRVENRKLLLKPQNSGLNNVIVDLNPVQDETISNIRYKYIDAFRQKYNEDNELDKEVSLPELDPSKGMEKTFTDLLEILGIPKDEFFTAKNNDYEVYKKLVTNISQGYRLFRIKNETIKVDNIDAFLTDFEGIGSSFKQLMLLNTDPNAMQLVFRNADNKKQYGIFNNTSWSQFINVLNLVKTKQDLLDTFPHLGNAQKNDFKSSLKHSVILKGLFDKNGKRTLKQLNYIMINGIDIDKSDGSVTANLNDIDRTIQRAYYLDKGIHYTMVNSDKSSEFAMDFGDLISDHRTKTASGFSDYLWDTYVKPQLDIYNSYLKKQDFKYEYFTKAINNGDLGFFGNVKLNEQGLIDIEDAKQSVKSYLASNIIKMVDDLTTLSGNIDLTSYFEEEMSGPAKIQFHQNIVYSNLISTIEQHLLVYGDPMFYKVVDGVLDSPKRTSAFNANREQILSSQEHWNELYKNTVRLSPKENNGLFKLSTFDDVEVMFQKDKLNHMLYDAYTSIKTTYPTDIADETIAKMLGITFHFEGDNFIVDSYNTEGYVKAYLKMNEADGQAYMLTDYYMDMMYRSDKLKPEQIDTLNWKKAKEIEIRSNLDKENPLYKEYSVMHRYWAKNIIKTLVTDPKGVLTALKPQYAGYSVNDEILVPSLLKNSVFPLHFVDLYNEETGEIVYPKAMDVYINAQNNNVDIVGHRSGQKFGATLDKDGKFTSLLKDGNITDEYPVIQEMYETFLGIQSEIPAKRKFEILGGSQIRKIITQNLWALAKTDPELADTLKEYTDVLNARFDVGLIELENKLGLKKENGVYVIDNPLEIVKQLQSELSRLNLPDNVKEIIELNSDGDNLKYKLESSPNNISLQAVLLSMVDKSLVHQKVRGKGSVQVAGTLFSNEKRTTEKVIVNGKEKEIATSSDLEFYYDKNGKVIGMEVLIPNPFYDVYPDLTWEQFKVMADKNPKLYQICGYRIPTQSMGQFETIVIKGFFNDTAGDSIIVPSGIVAKAGSDFDIDKLFLYLPHVTLNKNNQLEYIEYLDDSNSTVEERYKEFLKTKAFMALDQLKGIESYEEFSKQYFQPVFDELNTVINNKIDSTKEKEESNKQFQKVMDLATNFSNKKMVGIIIKLLTNKEKNIYERQSDLQDFINNNYSSYVPGSSRDTEFKELSIILSEYGLYLSAQNNVKELAKYLRESIKTRRGYDYFKKYFTEQSKNAVADFLFNNNLASVSLEDFKQLSIPAQNSKKALENRNLELMIKLASYKKNTYTSTIANSAETLQALANRKGTDTYLSIGSFTRQNEFRQANLSSKSLVGLAALHVTGHCITQNGETKLTGTFINRLGEEEDINITLPVPYQEFLSLDHIWDTDNKLISANLSEFLSAIVDAAKDPFIFEININRETLNIALYLTRLGVSLKDTVYFLTAPVIKNYLFNKQLQSSLFKKSVYGDLIKSQNLVLIESISHAALNKIGKAFPGSGINGEMFYKKGPFGIKTNPINGYPLINYDIFEEQLQYVYDTIKPEDVKSIDAHSKDLIHSTFILLSYMKYSEQAGYLGNLNGAISYDSKSPNSISSSVELQNRRSSLKEDNFIQNIDDLFTNTFLDNLHKNREIGLDMLGNYQIMANPIFKDNYLSPIIALLNKDKFLSSENKTKLINKFQNFLITYHLQNYEFHNGSVNSKKTTIKTNVIKYYNKVLAQNPEFKIFNLLTKNKVKENELENIVRLRSLVQTDEINKAIEELLEFLEVRKHSTDPVEKQEVANVGGFLRLLTRYSLLQSGFGPSSISFTNYLPLQTYTEYLNPAFEDLYNNIGDIVRDVPIAQLWKQFIQNNSTEDKVVEQLTEQESKDGDVYLGKGFTYSPKGLHKTFRYTDIIPLFVRIMTITEYGMKPVLYQIKNVKNTGNRFEVDYNIIPIFGKGKYSIETHEVSPVEESDVLTNIINNNMSNITPTFVPKSKTTETEQIPTSDLKGLLSKPFKGFENGLWYYFSEKAKEYAPEKYDSILNAKDYHTAYLIGADRTIAFNNGKANTPGIQDPDSKVYNRVIKELQEANQNTQVATDKIDNSDKPIFNSLPSKSSTPTMTYAGIGSRETPQEILDIMTEVAKYLDGLGYTLRSGAADGADTAFEKGATKKEIFKGFDPAGETEVKIAHEIHPNLKGAMEASKNKKIKAKLAEGATKQEAEKFGERSAWAVQNLMARNTNQVFGKNLNSTSDFVLFYAKETDNPLRPKGGTGQAVEMARRKGIPTINMADANWRDQLKAAIANKPVQLSANTETNIDNLTSEQKEFAKNNTIEQNFFHGKPYQKADGKWDVYKIKNGIKSAIEGALKGFRTQTTRSVAEQAQLYKVAENQGLPKGTVKGAIVWMEDIGAKPGAKNESPTKGQGGWFRITSEFYTPNKKDFNNFENWEDNVWEDRSSDFKIGTKNEWKSVRFEKLSTDKSNTIIKPGVEISSNAKGLAAALTNPTELAKSKGNLTQSYPVQLDSLIGVNKKGINSTTGVAEDAEAAYQALKSTADKIEPGMNSAYTTYDLMVDIIIAKLEQHPRLVTEIKKQGGSDWILSSTHQPTKQNSVWETGGKNWFIKSLNEAYQNVNQPTEIKPKIDSFKKIEVSKVNYTKNTPNDKSKGFFFTENLQAYLANRGRGAEERFDLAPKDVKLDVTATNNQAGIRRNNGVRNLNAFAIISKKYQQNGSGIFVKEEGQFKDTNEDFELFKKYNTEAIDEAIAYNKPLVIVEAGIAIGKSALPLRFAEWLNNELKIKLGIQGTIKENISTGYKGYGIFNLTQEQPIVEESVTNNQNVIEKPSKGVEFITDSGLAVKKANEFVDILSPIITKSAERENQSNSSNYMFSFGKRWTRIIAARGFWKAKFDNEFKNNPKFAKAISESDGNIKERMEVLNQYLGSQFNTQITPYNKGWSATGFNYGYDNLDAYGNPVESMDTIKPITEYIQSKIGIDLSNYNSVLANIYTKDQFIPPHRDTTEDVNAEGYAIVVLNIGADGSISEIPDDYYYKTGDKSKSRWKNLSVKNGGIYAFGVNGVNRFNFFHAINTDNFGKTTPTKALTLPDGSILKDYRITLTYRRVTNPTEDNAPNNPKRLQSTFGIIDNQNTQVQDNNLVPIKINQYQYTLNTTTGEVIHNAKKGDKVLDFTSTKDLTQIGKVYKQYAVDNNFETKSFNGSDYVKVFDKIVNISNGNIVTQSQIRDLFDKVPTPKEITIIEQELGGGTTFTYRGKSIETDFELLSDKKVALEKLIDFALDESKTQIVLQGAAGTGKTTLIGYLQKYLNSQFLYTAPTHAATVELAFATMKTGNKILPMTVASTTKVDPKTGDIVLSNKASGKIGFGRFIIVDEVSMLKTEDYYRIVELTERGYKIIYLGDKKQIPEVIKGEIKAKSISVAFTENESVNLDIIHRTSNEDIKKVLQNIRDSKTFQLYKIKNNTENLKFLKSNILFKTFLKEFAEKDPQNTDYIGYTNDSVNAMNKLIREQIFKRTGNIQAGDIVMGYVGYQNKQIERGDLANSVSYEVVEVKQLENGFELKLKSDRLSNLREMGFTEIPQFSKTIVYPLSSNEISGNVFSDNILEDNNKALSNMFKNVYDSIKRAKTSTNKSAWVEYYNNLETLGQFLSKRDLFSDYIYNYNTNRVELYNKSSPSTEHLALITRYGKELKNFVVEKGIDFGHAITIHKSQGKTTKNVFFDASTITSSDITILENGKQISTERQALVYVGMSRASENLFVYEGNLNFIELENATEIQPISTTQIPKKDEEGNDNKCLTNK